MVSLHAALSLLGVATLALAHGLPSDLALDARVDAIMAKMVRVHHWIFHL